MVGSKCKKCDKGVMELKRTNLGFREFLGCTEFPLCRYTESFKEIKKDLKKQADEILKNNKKLN
jgi:ssDNA-binding Zn-finger/Zn-ribbon topoisomerase 1